MMSYRHSPSSLKLFDTCPHRWYRERVLQDLDPAVLTDTTAADKGRAVHTQFENAAKRLAPWPEEYPHVETWFRDAVALYPSIAVERKLALDDDLRPCDFDGDRVWIRGIADLILWNGDLGYMVVVDYKTGKKRPGNELQMKFYALAAFMHSEKVDRVYTDLYWVATDQHDKRGYKRSNVDDLQRYIRTACERVDAAYEFPKRKGGLCRGYCPVSDCEHFRPPRDYHGPAYTFR